MKKKIAEKCKHLGLSFIMQVIVSKGSTHISTVIVSKCSFVYNLRSRHMENF